MAVSDEDIRHARNVVAEIVATHDAKYAPLFEILDTELQKREKRASAIKRSIAMTNLEALRAARRKRNKIR